MLEYHLRTLFLYNYLRGCCLFRRPMHSIVVPCSPRGARFIFVEHNQYKYSNNLSLLNAGINTQGKTGYCIVAAVKELHVV